MYAVRICDKMPLEYVTKTPSFYEGWSVFLRALILDSDDIIEIWV